MQNYPDDSSFSIGQSFWACVTPNKRFSISLYQQGINEALIFFPDVSWEFKTVYQVEYLGKSSNGRLMFQSNNWSKEQKYDTDWDWPAVQIQPQTGIFDNKEWTSGIYVIIAFEIDAQGNGIDAIGKRIDAGLPIYPYSSDSDAMSLIVARPQMPANANIAYIVPVATYHAYNLTGGGCFYDYPAIQNGGGPFPPQKRVSERRPGGGLGALLGEPDDPYDLCSPRQQAAHWDFKFIQWMLLKNDGTIGFDFYTDKDLHTGALNLSLYQLLVSVGHHEYWSEEMYNAAMKFLGRGQSTGSLLHSGDDVQYGNYACFSGNTCYRPISWDVAKGIITREADSWPNNKEWNLTGLSYKYGGGKWGDKGQYFGQWSNTSRPNYGYQVLQGCCEHWVFSNTNLNDGDTFGSNSYLVGYECDGLAPESSMEQLACSPVLNGFTDGATNRATFGIMGDQTYSIYKSGVTFNAGTTDWARVLINTDSMAEAADADILSSITFNVLRALSYRPDK